MKPVRVSTLDGHSIVRWVGTEMALSGSADDGRPVLWSHPSVPYLQLIHLDVQLHDGAVYRMLSTADDESGYIGLYLIQQNFTEDTSGIDIGGIYRTRELTELPIGRAEVVVTEFDRPGNDLRVDILVGGHVVSCWAAEIYERGKENFEVCGRDESILVQVDGERSVWVEPTISN